MAPSVIPRAWFFQGLLSGLWLVFAGIALAGIPLFTVLGANWQTELRLLFGMEGEGPSRIISQLVLGILLAAGLLGLGRLLRRASRWVSAKLARWIPQRAAILASVLIVAFLTIAILEGTLVRGTMSTLNKL